MDKDYKPYLDFLYNNLMKWGLSERWASYIDLLLNLLIVALLLIITTQLIKKLIDFFIHRSTRIKEVSFLTYLQKNKFPKYISLFVPYIGLKNFIPLIFRHFSTWNTPLDKIVDIWVVYIFIQIIMSIVKAAFDILSHKPAFQDKPIKSYLQVIMIVLTIFGVVVTYSIITGKSPVAFFTGIAAFSAIIMLIFQDSIKGFVASVLVTSNDMVRIGDWITMPKYGADGDVIEVNLTTVKVQNFDKTITTIPTYALISDSFQNWRGMVNAGGRRIKRAIILKQNSIRYIADDEIERFRKIQGIRNYIDERQKEIHEYNERIGADRSIAVNGRNLTNGGLFRQYAEWYLQNHPDTHKGYTMMVRQLAPTPSGIPLEIYAFTNTTKWIAYEHIMSDIFDHLIAAVDYFDLEIFELEAGTDIRKVETKTDKTATTDNQPNNDPNPNK